MGNMSATNISAHADGAYVAGCADFFRLASLFYLGPTAELAQGVLDKSIAADMRAIFEDAGIDPEKAALERLDEVCGQGFDVVGLHTELRRDYTALFTHPQDPLVSPYEMRFCDLRDGCDVPSTLFLNEAALHAEQCYREAGLALSDATSREPGDHIAIELEFMAYLHEQLAAALEAGDDAAWERWEKLRTDFLPHLERWGVDFFEACERSSCSAVYSWLGKAGAVFLGEYLARSASR